VATAFATIEPELLEVMRSLGASRRDMTFKIGIPRSLPFFFASLKIAITLAFVGSVIAEIVAGNSGIGNVMLVASSNFNVPLVFAALIVVGIMGIGMYAIFDFFERRMTSWSIRGGSGIQHIGGG
jgi:NitT/TauT family transport system permease protein